MASVVDTSVKFFHSGMLSAPPLNGTAGSMLILLQACLVDGFGLKSADSLTITANVATINFSSPHSAEVDVVVIIDGASPAALNGEQKVTAITANSISFKTSGLADQSATGSISMKLAPAGWSKIFSDVNLAAFKSANVEATGMILRVDDTNAKFARVVGYEVMTDVNTGTNKFPTETQQAGGLYWTKSSTADSAPRIWSLFADSKTIIFNRYPIGNMLTHSELSTFGDLVAAKSGDAFSSVISGSASDASSGNIPALSNNFYSDPSPAAVYAARSYTGLGTSQQLLRSFQTLTTALTSFYSGNVTDGVPFPNAVDNGLYMTNFNLCEVANKSFRGIYPGMYAVPQNAGGAAFSHLDKVPTVGNLAGRIAKAIPHYNTTYNTAGVVFIEITGPWR
ncbi:hypothetical protein KDM87_14340 [Undibacterium sp. FT147W]|uniref:Beta-1,3-glucanase N-terminal domain-containing protein n=1 Tax=Undibacterium rivi TaxID=2828729 RepID=A0ABS5H583_9BURK|nr:hypothetical protein [Undibacterium rivi]MBR7793775.1 hypothetical protein [Undibacterium rivi]